MKKLNILIIIYFVLSTTAFAQFSGGNGTEDSPFLISSKEDMEYLANSVTLGYTYEGRHFLLTQDLTKFNTVNTIIGNGHGASVSNCFKGNFDGNNHVIEVNLEGKFINVSIFSSIMDAEIKNLKITGNISLLAKGYNSGEIGGVAGICGYAYNSTIMNCTNEAILYTDNWGGGICGIAENSVITNCHNNGKITSDGTNTGGICANIKGNTVISNCHNTADISCYPRYSLNNIYSTGGICASANDNSSILNCYNEGKISAVSGAYPSRSTAGGICGFSSCNLNGKKIHIRNCYSTGTIFSQSLKNYESYSGGILGLIDFNYGSILIENCFAANKEIILESMTPGYERIGRICGVNKGLITNCFALFSTVISMDGYPGLSDNTLNGKNGKDMEQSFFQDENWITQNLGWDFSGTWEVEPNHYPTLQQSSSGNSTNLRKEINILPDIYPNPTKDFFIIDIPNINKITVIDLQGNTQYKKYQITEGEEINISSLPNGLYFVIIETESNKEIKRLIKI